MLQGKKVGKFFEPLLPIDLSKHGVKQKLVITTGLPGAVAINSFPFSEITKTSVKATSDELAQVYDEGDAFYKLSSSSSGTYAADYQLFPDADAIGDAAYFGYGSKFCVIFFDISATVATYAGDSCVWQYFDGSTWQTLTIIYDGTDSTAQDGKRPFQEDGYLVFSPPSDWKKTSINGKNAYWIRSYIETADVTQIPILAGTTYHHTISASYPFKAPVGGTITRIRFTWDTNSSGTADTKLVLVNLTQQTISAEKTHTKSKQIFSIDDLDLDVDEGDELLLFITQVDGGGTEFTDGRAEIEFN
ncbi:MAG TPA: hypothetical protein VFG01_07200 [Acidobacteriota bacterium]|nr:hypothetical protein [Acidobacteriota bacterium]